MSHHHPHPISREHPDQPAHFAPLSPAREAELVEQYGRNPQMLADDKAPDHEAASHNKKVVLATVGAMGFMLKYVGFFGADEEVVMTGIRQNWRAAQFATKFMGEPEFLTGMARERPLALIYSTVEPAQLEAIFNAAKVGDSAREEILKARAARVTALVSDGPSP